MSRLQAQKFFSSRSEMPYLIISLTVLLMCDMATNAQDYVTFKSFKSWTRLQQFAVSCQVKNGRDKKNIYTVIWENSSVDRDTVTYYSEDHNSEIALN